MPVGQGHLPGAEPACLERDRVAALALGERAVAMGQLFIGRTQAVDQKLLVSALKGADAKHLDKVLRNLSQRTGEMLRDEIASRGPMRMSDIEDARREIIAIAQRLEQEGAIMLPTDSGDLVT